MVNVEQLINDLIKENPEITIGEFWLIYNEIKNIEQSLES